MALCAAIADKDKKGASQIANSRLFCDRDKNATVLLSQLMPTRLADGLELGSVLQISLLRPCFRDKKQKLFRISRA